MKYIRKSKKILCLFLIFITILMSPLSHISASGDISTSSLQFSEDQEQSNAQQVYNELTPEAKTIFLEYMIHSNSDLLDYHMENVIESSEEISLRNKILLEQSNESLIATYAAGSDVLNVLEENLRNISELSENVIYALMGAASSILADIASLGTAKIATIILAAGCLVTLLAHWNELQYVWNDIVDSFKIAFKSYFSADDVKSEFSIAKMRIQQDSLANKKAKDIALVCEGSNSCNNHVIYAEAETIMHKGKTLAIYSSYYTDIAMIVIGILNNTSAHISRNLSTTDKEWKDVSMGKLYVLYDVNTLKYFHMHISIFGDDTHYLREANGLCYQIYPYLTYDPQYDHPKHSLQMPLNNNW